MKRWSVEIVAVVALLLRLVVVLLVGFNIDYFDVDGYHRAAVVGLSGAPVPSYVHPPGYSWFVLAIYEFVGPRPRVVYLVQALLSALTVFLIGDAARRRWGNRAGVAAAVLMATNGYAAILASVIAGETVALFGVSLAVWLLLPNVRRTPPPALVGAALLIGTLALVRTGLLLLIAIPVVIALLEPTRTIAKRFAMAASVVVIGMAVPLAYGVDRSERTGVVRIGSPWDSRNLWIGNNPYAAGRIEPMPDEPPFAASDTEFEYRRARVWWDRSVAYALDNPRAEVELFFSRLSFLAAPAKRDLIYIYGHGWAGERSATVVWSVYWWAACAVPLLMFTAFVAFARGTTDEAWWLAVVMIGLGAAPYLASLGDARFMLPFHGALAFASAAAFRQGSQPQHRWWRLPVAVVLSIAFAANTAYDLWKTDPAIRAVAAPGGSKLNVPYHFAR